MLWRRAADGDAEAFGLLYERHARAVQAFCLWRTGDPVSADDLTSIVFLEAWRRRAGIRLTTDSARPFLLGVAANVVREQRRGRRRHRAALSRLRDGSGFSESHDEDAVERVAAVTELQRLRERLRSLPMREREVLAQAACGGLSYEEIAAALGVPVGTVRSRLSRGRARLHADPCPATGSAVGATTANSDGETA
jgi:RNA polymerase sigma-70 factor (ECF subfamily)